MNTGDRRALLVLGMHRSGTSALTRVLNLLGVQLGEDLLPAHRDNEAGFWEHREIVLLHDELLHALGSSWKDPAPIPAAALTGDIARPFRERLEAIVERDFAGVPHFGLKDPRLCRLLPLWLPMLDGLGYRTGCALIARHPDEVAASLAKRDGMPDDTARVLWMTHTIDAERESRGVPRAFLTYDGILDDWRTEVRRLAAALSLDWEEAIDKAGDGIDAFLRPGLRHHATGDVDPAGGDWIERTWEGFQCGAGGQVERAGAALERVARELHVAGRLFFPMASRAEKLQAKLDVRSRQYLELRREVEGLQELVGAAEGAPAALAAVPAAAAPAAAADDDHAVAVATEAAGIRGDAAAAHRPRPGQADLERPGTTIVRNVDRLEGNPRVSIVIPLFNQAELTGKCLESLAEHTADGTFEVILVDNGSTDATSQLLECLEGNVKIVRNGKNLGFATACNQGAALAATDLVLFLNNDIEAKEGWLPPLLELMDADPSVGIAGSRLLFPTGEIQHAGVALLERPSGAFPLGAFHVHYGADADCDEASRPTRFQAVTGACLLVRRKLFDEVGGFDTYFWNGCEDVDFCLKVGAKGWKVVYEPRSVLVHHESKSGPQRFSRTKTNEDLLASRWHGKVEPDMVENPDGSRALSAGTLIAPYVRPGEVEAGDVSAAAEAVSPDQLTSIVILARNGLEDTRICLESVHRHTPEPHEVIVVDNGSADGTAEWLRERQKAHGNLRVITNRDNRGFAAGNNLGLAVAHGGRIVLLNNDTAVTDGWLSGMERVLARHPECGLVGPMSNYVSGPQLVANVPYRALEEMERFATEWACDHSGSRPCARIVGFCWLMRREVLDAIGGLDERFGTGNFEDDDYCLRAAQAGWHARIADGVFVHHTGSRTFRSERIDYAESVKGNFAIFREKWGLGDHPVGVPYPFAELVEGEKRPRVALPQVAATHELLHRGRWYLDRRATAEARADTGAEVAVGRRDDRVADAETGALDASTYRVSVGLLPDGEPSAEVRALFTKYGFEGEPPVWETTDALDEQLRTRPLVLLLGPDVIVPDDALQEMIAVLKYSGDIAAVGPVSNAAPAPQRAKPAYRTIGRDLRRFAARRRRRRRGAVTEAPYLGGFCVLLRSSLVQKAGGLDTERALPDALLDLYGRIAERGDRVVVAQGAWVHHARLTETEGAGYGRAVAAVAAAAPGA